MKKIILSLILVSSLVFSLNASATKSYPDPLRPGTIDSITIGGTGHIYIYMTSPPGALTTNNGTTFCSTRGYVVKNDNPQYDYFFTYLVLAWKEGYDVNFAFHDGSCFANRYEVHRFNVVK